MTEQAAAPSVAVEATPGELKGPDTGVPEVNQEIDTSSDEYPTEPPKPEKYKVKYGDVEEEVDLEKLKKSYTLDKVLTQRGQEVAETKKQIEAQKAQLTSLLQNLKDPEKLWNVLGQLGHNPEELALRKAYEKYQWEQLPEHERQRITLERRAQALQAQLDDRDRVANQAKQDEQSRVVESQIESDVLKVAELLDEPIAGKKGAVTIERIAQAYQSLYNANKIKPSHEQVAKTVRQILDQDLNGFLSKLDPAKAVEVLPKALLNGLRDLFIKQAEKKLPFSSSPGVGVTNDKAQKKVPEKMGFNEYFKKLGV